MVVVCFVVCVRFFDIHITLTSKTITFGLLQNTDEHLLGRALTVLLSVSLPYGQDFYYWGRSSTSELYQVLCRKSGSAHVNNCLPYCFQFNNLLDMIGIDIKLSFEHLNSARYKTIYTESCYNAIVSLVQLNYRKIQVMTYGDYCKHLSHLSSIPAIML